MAGKHRESSASNTVAKVGALAGLAVTASLLSAGSAQAGPLTDALNKLGNRASTAHSNVATATNKVTVPAYSKVNTGNFFTNPTTVNFQGGQLITVKQPTPQNGGVTYVTSPGFRITGICLNSKGCS